MRTVRHPAPRSSRVLAPRTLALWLTCCVLAMVASIAAAEDDAPKAPRTHEPRCLRYARVVTRMVDRNDMQRLRQGQRGLDPDPWLLAWILVAQGRQDVARVLIRECACPETKALATRLEAWVRARPDPDTLERVVTMESGLDTNVLDFDRTIEASEPLRAGADPFLRALALIRGGDALRRQGRHDEAAKQLALAEKTSEEIGWTWGHDQAQFQRGKLELQTMRPEEALATLEIVVQRRESLEWKSALGFAYADLAAALGTIDDYRGVLAFNAKAQPLLDYRFHLDALYRVHANKGHALAAIGDLAAALFEYEEAASLAGVHESRKYLADAHAHIAWMQARLGRFEAAAQALATARKHAATLPTDREGHPHPMVTLVEGFAGGILGLRAQALGDPADWEAAFAAHATAREAFLAQHEEDLAARAQLAQATVRAWQGRHEEALTLLEEAGKDLTALPQESSAIEALLLGGWIRLKQGDAARAAEAFQDAWKRAKAIELLHAQAVALHGRAATRAAGVDALKPDLRAAARRTILDDVEAAVAIHARLASGLAEEQVASARDGFAVTPLGQGASARMDLHELGLTAALALGDAPRMFRLIESARALGFVEAHGGMARLREAGTATDETDEERRARRAEGLARVALERASRLGDVSRIRRAQARVADAVAHTASVLEKAQRRAKARANAVYPRPASTAEVQAALEAQDVFVDFAVADGRVHAIVVKPNGIPSLKTLGPLAPVVDALAALHDDVEDVGAPSREAFDRLRTLLIEPLGGQALAKRMLVSPDGVLHGAPFAALVPTCEVTQVPSASAWLAIRRDDGEPGAAVVGLGAPTYAKGRSLPALPGSARELEALPGEHVTRLTADKATLAALRAALPTDGARLRVLHLGCHGRPDEEHPSSSALELAADKAHGGPWMARDIMLTDLPADLVVLSACETGVGRAYRGEGLLGLPRAFLIAGAQRVVASLWKADDEATSFLMTRFYAGLAGGKPAAAALCAAQAAVKADKRWAHPYYWAAWVIWGREG